TACSTRWLRRIPTPARSARTSTREPECRGVSRAPAFVVRYGRSEAARSGAAGVASRDPAWDALPLCRLGDAGSPTDAVPARRRAQRAYLGHRLLRAQDGAALPGARPARSRRQRVVAGDGLRDPDSRG